MLPFSQLFAFSRRARMCRRSRMPIVRFDDLLDEPMPHDIPSIAKFTDFVQLKDYRQPTKDEYVRYVRKLAEHHRADPATLTEDQLRAYFLFLRQEKRFDPETGRDVYSTQIYGGGVNKTWAGADPAKQAYNERFLEAQMAAVRETMPNG